jgi:hypothetical protein
MPVPSVSPCSSALSRYATSKHRYGAGYSFRAAFELDKLHRMIQALMGREDATCTRSRLVTPGTANNSMSTYSTS